MNTLTIMTLLSIGVVVGMVIYDFLLIANKTKSEIEVLTWIRMILTRHQQTIQKNRLYPVTNQRELERVLTELNSKEEMFSSEWYAEFQRGRSKFRFFPHKKLNEAFENLNECREKLLLTIKEYKEELTM